MIRAKIVLLMGFMGLSILPASAEDLTNRWGLGLWGGPAIPTGTKYITKNADTGLNLGGWARQGVSPRWSIALSYDNLDLRKGDIHLQPIMISMVYSFHPSRRLTPIFSLGAGPSLAKILPTDSAGDTTLGFKAGAGLEWFLERNFSVGALLNYHYVLKNSGSSHAAQILAPLLMANYYFAGPAEPEEEEEVAEESPEAAAPPSVEDSDADGVEDSADKCPATPASAKKVNGEGCQFDSDNDGVADEDDECPDTPEGKNVNRMGCPVPAHVSIRMNVQFDSGKADIKPEFHDQIAKVAEFMIDNPNAEGEIEGHTDNVGSDKSNLALSQRRAENVRQYLVEKFSIYAARLTAKGYGASEPVASNATTAGRRLNRRVVADLTAER